MLFVRTSSPFGQRKRQWDSKKHRQPRKLIISFLIHVTFLCWPTTYTQNDAIEGETGHPIVPFPSSLPTHQQVGSRECWLNVCVSGSERKAIQLVWRSMSMFWWEWNRHTHAWVMEHHRWHVSDSACEFSALMFAFNTIVALCKGECKAHARKLY